MKKLFIAIMVVFLMTVSFAQEVPAGEGVFNFTKLDLTVVTDLAGYRIYLVPPGQQVVIGTGQHFWQSADNNPTVPFTVPVPEGTWDSYLTSFDLTGNESDPSPVCTLTIDDVPPTPPGYGCQAAQ